MLPKKEQRLFWNEEHRNCFVLHKKPNLIFSRFSHDLEKKEVNDYKGNKSEISNTFVQSLVECQPTLGLPLPMISHVHKYWPNVVELKQPEIEQKHRNKCKMGQGLWFQLNHVIDKPYKAIHFTINVLLWFPQWKSK